MEWGRLVLTGHGHGKRSRRARYSYCLSREEYHYCSGQLTFSCQTTTSTETLEYIVYLLLPWLCTILVDSAVHTPLCTLGMLNTPSARQSCSPISSLLLLAAGSISTLRLRYRPNQLSERSYRPYHDLQSFYSRHSLSLSDPFFDLLHSCPLRVCRTHNNSSQPGSSPGGFAVIATVGSFVT